MNYIWISTEVVLALLVAAGCGFVLVKKNILHPQAIKDLSKIVIYLILPCLLFSKIIEAISFESLRDLWIFPAAAFIFIVAGLGLGYLVGHICRQKELARGLSVGMGFANSGYIPLGILAALAFQGAEIFGPTDILAEGTAYISLYLIVFSPMMWSVGFFVLTGESVKSVKTMFPPPVIAAVAAMVLGLCPFTKGLFVGYEAPLNLFLQAADILGQATVPLALLILGGNLAQIKRTKIIKLPTIISFLLVRFGVMPLLAIGVMLFFKRAGFIDTNMMAFIIVLEGCMPPGTNLLIMCQVKEHNREFMTTLIFWTYLFSIPAIAFWLYIIFTFCI